MTNEESKIKMAKVTVRIVKDKDGTNNRFFFSYAHRA